MWPWEGHPGTHPFGDVDRAGISVRFPGLLPTLLLAGIGPATCPPDWVARGSDLLLLSSPPYLRAQSSRGQTCLWGQWSLSPRLGHQFQYVKEMQWAWGAEGMRIQVSGQVGGFATKLARHHSWATLESCPTFKKFSSVKEEKQSFFPRIRSSYNLLYYLLLCALTISEMIYRETVNSGYLWMWDYQEGEGGLLLFTLFSFVQF